MTTPGSQLAHRCKTAILSYWAERGYSPRVWIECVDEPPHWKISSDMVDGWPRRDGDE